MDRIKYRDLQRWRIDDLLKVLPVSVTRDSQATMVILTIEDYNKLVQLARNSHDSQAIPVYKRGVKYEVGSRVMYQGRVITVPEIDGYAFDND